MVIFFPQKSEKIIAFLKIFMLYKGHFEKGILEIVSSLCDFAAENDATSHKFTLRRQGNNSLIGFKISQ